MNKWIKKLCVVGLVLCPVSNALAWCNSCGGDGSCCRCPSGQAQCLYGHASCEEACGLTSSSSGGLSTDPTTNMMQGLMNNNSQQFGIGLFGAILQDASRRNSGESARQAAEAQARAEELRRANEEALLKQQEEKKNRLLGGMMGVGEAPQLGLMGTGSGSDLQLMTGDQSVSASTSPPKPNENPPQSPPKSTAFTQGYDDASQCISQNSGTRCEGLAGNQWQTCLDDYRAGYQVGDKERVRLMQQAMQAGQLAGESGELANGASDPRAEGPCRADWIVTYNKGYFQGKHAKAREIEIKPAAMAAAKVDSEEARIINGMNALAKRLGWSVDEQARLNDALNKLGGDGDPATSAQISQAWDDVLARGHGGDFVREAAQGEGPGFPGAGEQTRYQDCAIFALANASGQPYGVVAARAAKLIGEGEWHDAAERANPQKVIEQKGLIGGEVVMLSEALGQVEVVASTDFAKTLKGGRPVMVNVVPEDGNVKDGHEVVLTKTFQHDGETWYEMMDSNQGPQRRLYLSSKELNTMLQEKGVAFRPESETVPKLLR